jgi:hypothetical protein
MKTNLSDLIAALPEVESSREDQEDLANVF